MSKEYSQQQITQFFQQFRKLENSYPIEKVHQLINNPNARARYKVKNVKPLNLIIMTFLISISLMLVLLFSSPDSKQENHIEQAVPTVDKGITFSKENPIQSVDLTPESNEKEELESVKEGIITSSLNPALDKNKPDMEIQGKSALSDTVIDGSRFILELTNAELEKLGFKINHYSVYYRNSYNNVKVFYLATHSNGRFFVRADSLFYNLRKEYYPLQTDTIPQNINLKYLKTTKTGMGYTSDNSIREDIEYFKSAFSFYPFFNSNQAGDIEKINNDFNFEELADTLIPVVIKFSQLDLENKRDQFFWFITNNDFYENLPERYAWVKQEFENIKSAKRAGDNKLNVDFKIENWNKELLIPENVVLDGKDYIVQFTKEELEKIGVFKKDNNLWFYNHKTPYGGSAGGLLTEIVDGKPQLKYDTIFNTDYFIKYGTDCMGDFLENQTTIQRMDEFFNEDDILLPVQVENRNGNIYWFTLSDNFWKLVPARYQYLKGHYDQMLYNKSIEPNRNFAKYFTDPFKKIGVDVTFLELSKEELEAIGFNISAGKNEISCGYQGEWFNYHFEDIWNIMQEENKEFHKKHNIKRSNVFEFYEHIGPKNLKFYEEKGYNFDSIYQASNQGYQFVFVTDSLGRQMNKSLVRYSETLDQSIDLKYLIPVMVRNSKLATPYSEDRIFWFTPTKAFFDRLPDRIKNELKEEYEIVSSEGKSSELSSCTYFESCRSTLKVDKLKIYPNPAKSEITIDFSLDTAQKGEISLANIAGLQIKVLKPKSTFDEGFNSIKCRLDGIKPGIYLVSIITNAGFKTERIIITE